MTSNVPAAAGSPRLSAETEERLRGLRSLVGNTPLLVIDYKYRGEHRVLYAKQETLNMTGSVKDRMALHILQCAYEKRALKPGALIVEATSGNTGISFAALGRALGHRVAIFMPNWLSPERINLIRSFGAEIHLVKAEEGGFLESIRLSEDLAARTPGAFLPRQFSNDDNSEAHARTTGPEIWSQLRQRDLSPDAFVGGVGTGGTVMGTGRFLRTRKPEVKVYPLEPASSPTLSTGHKVGKHRIQGISDEFIPPIVDLKFLDRVIAVDDGDAILMAQKLARRLGLAVGISSGGNFLGGVQVQSELGAGSVVVTVFSDSNKKYLSTDLMREEPVKKDFLSPDVELLGFRSISRTCETCWKSEG